MRTCCHDDMSLHGINRRPYGIADVCKTLPQIVFQPDLSDAERQGLSDRGLLFLEPPAVQE
jgi:hypothetical protein